MDVDLQTPKRGQCLSRTWLLGTPFIFHGNLMTLKYHHEIVCRSGDSSCSSPTSAIVTRKFIGWPSVSFLWSSFPQSSPPLRLSFPPGSYSCSFIQQIHRHYKLWDIYLSAKINKIQSLLLRKSFIFCRRQIWKGLTLPDRVKKPKRFTGNVKI